MEAGERDFTGSCTDRMKTADRLHWIFLRKPGYERRMLNLVCLDRASGDGSWE